MLSPLIFGASPKVGIYFNRITSINVRALVNPILFVHQYATAKDPKLFSPPKTDDRLVKVNRAMKAYLDRSKLQDDFMKEQTAEYEIGKRHLANIMGADPDNFTQDDIDNAIAYLMPSGIFDKFSRPKMKHPKDIFPKRKDAEFGKTGRPFNPFFYTGKPHYFQLLFNIVDNLQKLDDFEDTMIRKGIKEPLPELKLELGGSEWFSYEMFLKQITEEVPDYNYDYFIKSITSLTEHPYSYRCKDFIMKYRKPLLSSNNAVEIPSLTIDENGKTYSKGIGRRKKTTAEVVVFANGTGKVLVNGKDITYFPLVQDREQLLFPLQFTGLLNKVDVVAEIIVTKGGSSCHAGAIRHGMSLALRSFVDSQLVEKMRLAGLLTKDPRVKERQKPGQEGARRKYTWKKR